MENYPKKGIENYPKNRIENYPSHMARAIKIWVCKNFSMPDNSDDFDDSDDSEDSDDFYILHTRICNVTKEKIWE